MSMSQDALVSLAAMPDQLERLYRSVPAGFARWEPPSWEGFPGETFAALGQLCHVRDIEIDGYQVRIRRLLAEVSPSLVSLDGYALAKERRYAEANAAEVLASFRTARANTLALLQGLGERDWKRRGHFEGYGEVTLEGVVRFLCSHEQQHLACLHWLIGKIASLRRQA